MGTVSTNDLKTGMALDLDGQLVQVLEFQHVKPGKGGAFVRTKLKNVRTGAVVDRTFRAAEKVGHAFIEKREQQFLYKDGSGYTFMDNKTYEQVTVPTEDMGDAVNYLTDGMTISVMTYNEEIVGTDLPAIVELEVTETEPGLKGDRVAGARKPATLETGLQLQVPLFVNQGERIKVDTRTGEYQTRA